MTSCTLCGLRSRWTIPFACAAPSALHIWTPIASTWSAGIGAAADRVAQRLARQVLHDEVRLTVGGLAEVEDLDDVLVRDHVDRARLVEEAGDDVGIARQNGVQQLDRHLAAEDRVLGEVDDAHSALAQKARDPVVPDRVVNQSWRWCDTTVASPQPRRAGAENLKILSPSIRTFYVRHLRPKSQLFPGSRASFLDTPLQNSNSAMIPPEERRRGGEKSEPVI